ncbi:mycothiol transferase [Egicoccus halophilus]|nr:methyltransferase domain-containing protein [Egicoccus halophilus]
MDTRDLLTDAFSRLAPLTRELVEGADGDLLHARLDPQANTLAWLLWHTARQQDVQVAALADREPVWTAEGWADRFDLPLDVDDFGYGHEPDDVAAVRVADPTLLSGYQDAVAAMVDAHLATLDADALDRVIDASYDPPVTVGVRLVSVVGDALQHLGQAAFLRGVLERRQERIADDFDQRAATWDDDPTKVERARFAAEAVLAAVDPRPDARVLEYGAGTGLLAQHLAPRVGPLTLADPSSGMRAVMQAKVERGILPDAQVVDLDLSQPVDDVGPFDLVALLLALHHVPDPAPVVANLAEVLAPGGSLAIVDLEPEDGSFHGEGFEGHPGIDPDRLRTWCEAAGLGEVDVVPCGTMERHGQDYPLFLATARRPAQR